MKIKFLPFLLLLLVKISFAQNVSIDVSVNKNNIKVGEAFSYQIKVRVESKTPLEIIVPEFSDFKVISRKQVHSYKIRKGCIESVLSYNFILIPLQKGDFEIKGFKVKFESKEYKVEAVRIKVEGVKKTYPKDYSPVKKIWI